MTVIQHRRKKLVHDLRLVFWKEEFLHRRLPRFFDILQTNHLKSSAIDKEGNTFQIADADEVGAVFDERDKHLPVAFGTLLSGNVTRNLRRAHDVSCLVFNRRDGERNSDALAVTAHSLGFEVLDSVSFT